MIEPPRRRYIRPRYRAEFVRVLGIWQARVRHRQLPHSFLYITAPEGQISWAVDGHSATVKVADVFLENNHVHAGFLGLNILSSNRSRQRFEGFAERCAQNKMTPSALLKVNDEDAVGWSHHLSAL